MSAEVRQSAIDPAGSFLVQAPAGSGKTELLTRRILKLLAVVDEPEEILALTFTRKAAAEMRGRVIEALSMPKPDDDAPHKLETWQLAQEAGRRSAERGWNLAAHPSRLHMMTLDSFTHSLARQMPLLSGFGDMPVPSTHVEPLYREAAERAVGILVQRNPEQAAAVLLHQDHNMMALIALVADMLGKRDQWLHEVRQHVDDPLALRAMLEQSLTEIMGQQLNKLDQLLPPDAKNELPALIAFAATNRGVAELAGLQGWPAAELEHLPLWQQIASELMTGKNLRKPGGINVKRGFPAGDEFAAQKKRFQNCLEQLAAVPELEESLAALLSFPTEPCFDAAQWQVLEAQLSLLLIADKQLQQLFEQRGEADFTEIAMRAMRALEDEAGRPTDLLLRLDYRIHHILVDEFQDTSLLQMRLLQNLTEGWQSGDGVHRTLFMVGDPMQSIYRFRKAEVGLFLLAAANRAGLPYAEPKNLTSNFRSSPAIVEWVNRAFATIFPKRPDILLGAVGHSLADAALDHAGEVHLRLQVEADAAVEASAVVATVRQEKEKGRQRIAVLARSRKHLHAIMQRLHEEEIRFRAVDILPLDEQAEIRLLRALLRALLHPADRVSWTALLRAPCCGLDTVALHRLLAEDERPLAAILRDTEKLGRLDADARARAEFLLQALDPCLKLAGRIDVRALLSLAWKRLGMPGLLAPDASRNIEAMLNLVEAIDEGGLIDFALLDERLQKLYAAPDSSPEAAAVELLTMHGAKGLQWDAVILPGLGYGPPPGDSPLLAFTDVPTEVGVQPLIAVRGAVRSSDAIYNLVRSVEKVRERNEDARLLYVACTRAETSLHMFGHLSGKEQLPASGSLLALLLPEGVGDCFGAEVSMLEAEGVDSVALRPQLTRVKALPPLGEAAAMEAAIMEETVESEYFWAGPEAAPVGTAVHAALQWMGEKGIEHWQPGDTDSAMARMRRMLILEGLSGDLLEAAVKRAAQGVEKALQSEKARWVLSGKHTDAHCEWALSTIEDGIVRHSVIDRSFIDQEGIRWIVDYKTGSHEGAGLDAFLASEGERYAEQLSRYRALLRELESEREIRTALYFPMLDAWHEVKA